MKINRSLKFFQVIKKVSTSRTVKFHNRNKIPGEGRKFYFRAVDRGIKIRQLI